MTWGIHLVTECLHLLWNSVSVWKIRQKCFNDGRIILICIPLQLSGATLGMKIQEWLYIVLYNEFLPLFLFCQLLPYVNSDINRLWVYTRYNSADSLPTSKMVCIKEVAIRTTFSHMINIAGIIYYTCSLVIDNQCGRYKNAFNKPFFVSKKLR